MRSSSTSVHMGDAFAAGMFVTWTAPEGNVSRSVVQSLRDSESPQPANATHAMAISIACVRSYTFQLLRAISDWRGQIASPPTLSRSHC